MMEKAPNRIAFEPNIIEKVPNIMEKAPNRIVFKDSQRKSTQSSCI